MLKPILTHSYQEKKEGGEEDDIDKDFESHSHLQLTFLRAAKHQFFLH